MSSAPDALTGCLAWEGLRNGGRERVERLGQIALDADCHRIVGVDLGGESAQVQDALLAVRVDFHGVELLHLVPDADQDVGRVEAEVAVVVTHETDRTERVRMVVREDAFTVEGGRDR